MSSIQYIEDGNRRHGNMAWGMYGIPLPANTDIKSVFQPMEVGDLDNTLEDINFLQGNGG